MRAVEPLVHVIAEFWHDIRKASNVSGILDILGALGGGVLQAGTAYSQRHRV